MIYIQSNNRIPMWDFGSHALHACLNRGKSYKLCEDWDIPMPDATCLVGSVEWCQKWLNEYGHKVPDAINLFDFEDHLERNIWIQDCKEFLETNKTWPVFVKPLDQIKAFTGTIVTSNFDAHCVLQGFEGKLCVQDSIEPILSEWRVYINRGKVMGCKPYKGDNLIFPNKDVVKTVLTHALGLLNNVSFTLDFGIVGLKRDQLGDARRNMFDSIEALAGEKFSKDKIWHKTFLIEPNDGWAIGNYGLEPEDYLMFCQDRWKQMINI